jgi:RNA polymerase sigma-70 factor (ECF subfamily)
MRNHPGGASVWIVVIGDPDSVQAFASGDADAIRGVYRRYGQMVYSVAYKVLGDRGLAEDATQQTFLQAWQAATRYDPSRELGPWLATIARRVAIDIYRKHRQHQSIDSADGVELADPALVSLPPSVEQIYHVWEVRRALDSMPAQDRELIEMQHYREMTLAEIAERLAIPVGTVKSRTYRAHQRLAGLLGHLRAKEVPSDG